MQVEEKALREFASGLQGEVVRAADAAYEDARRIWNGMIDKRPALIVRCRTTDDVVRAVNFARDHELPLSVRGGGHSAAGTALIDDGLVIDLSPMNEVRVDAEGRTASAEGGTTWGEFDKATQAFGLATTGGIVSTTGIAGLTLGGGLGFLMRKHGLACDNLLGVEIVTADGIVRKANSNENSDLFWAVRGGGGNFGIVTSFEYRLHPLGKVLFGPLIHPLDRAGQVLRFYRKFMEGAADEVTADVAFIRSPDGAPIVAIAPMYAGPVEEGTKVLQPLRDFGPPVADQIQPIAYLDHRGMFDAYFPSGLRNYWKSNILEELGDGVIDTMARHFARAPSPRPAAVIESFGGAIARVGREDTAFDHRVAPFGFILASSWSDPAEDASHKAWVRGLWQDLQPYASKAVYVNYLGEETEEGRDRVEAAYGTKYGRLAAIKKKYDPENLFRSNMNIRPAG